MAATRLAETWFHSSTRGFMYTKKNEYQYEVQFSCSHEVKNLHDQYTVKITKTVGLVEVFKPIHDLILVPLGVLPCGNYTLNFCFVNQKILYCCM